MMKFHHIGIIVRDIIEFESKMIYEDKICEVFDPLQNANLILYRNFGNSLIELIQPVNEKSFTWSFLQKNGNFGFHHLCYQVKNLNILEEIKVKYNLISVLGPLPALLFDGKDVAFYYSRNKTIIEFLISEDEATSHF